ncbi:hypothetical protein, partial [Endozoicomonas sp. ONNA1]|uniref:hypothetical protein n=1 Tax=Endozoicomonas sp. ONNA1 TaxID=2828740 RepID=UPI002147BE39
MKTRYITANRLDNSDDWRASYHLSPAALLPEMGEHWPSIQQMGSDCIEGWRTSLKPVAGLSERDIDEMPFYRLRHIENSILETDSHHAQTPVIKSKPFCIQPWDVAIKKVGGIKAALTLPEHGQHPADANLAIIRGMKPEQALWLTKCLEQPLYRDYLESSERITSLIRVGIKQLKQMPLNPMPERFKQPASAFIAQYRQLAEARYQLDVLRQEVNKWMKDWQQGLERFINQQPWQKRWQSFPASDIGDNWLMSYTEQRYMARLCVQEYNACLLENLASINPRQPEYSGGDNRTRALRIRDIDNHFGLSSQPQPLSEMT